MGEGHRVGEGFQELRWCGAAGDEILDSARDQAARSLKVGDGFRWGHATECPCGQRGRSAVTMEHWKGSRAARPTVSRQPATMAQARRMVTWL